LIKNKQKQAKMTKNSLKTRKNDKKSKSNYFLFLAIFLTYMAFYSQNNSEKTNPKKIVLMGNSITEHWQTYNPLFFKKIHFL
jgi:hypothetical protein